LTGREARMAHHRWADIPESLIAKWEADDHAGST
jgi:hypothetical protein